MELNTDTTESTARNAHAPARANKPRVIMVQGEFHSQKVRIHAGLMSQEEQEDFASRALEKVMHLIINEGIKPEFALAGLQAFTEIHLMQGNQI